MRLRVITALVLLATLLLTTGCNGSRELDDLSFVLDIGVDAGEGDQLVFTYRIALPRALAASAGGGGSGADKKTTQLITITAPTLAESLNLLNSTVARAPNLTHVTGILVGEDLARRGLADFLASVTRAKEYRGSIYIVVVDGKAKDFLKQNSPEEEIASRWIEAHMSTADETGYYLKTTLHDFYVRLKTGSGSPYAVLMGINPLKGDGATTGPSIPGAKAREYLPKDLPREEGNPATVIGTAVFKADKMVGMLPSAETHMLAILLGYYPHAFLAVNDPMAPQYVLGVHLKISRKPNITVAILDGQATINVDVSLEGEISSIPSGINYESKEYKGLLEQQISQTVRQRMLQMLQRTQAWGADVVDFGYFLRPRFATDQELKNLNWDAAYRKAEFDVVVTTAARRPELMRKTSPIRSEER